MRLKIKRFKRQRRTLLWTLLVGAIMASGAYAYTNTISGLGTPPNLGSGGPGAINGYDVTNIAYNLNAANPLNVDSIQFNLGQATSSTAVQIQAASGGSWYACSAPSGAAPVLVVCPTAGLTAAAANNLTVVANH
jgi:hypothetical protein